MPMAMPAFHARIMKKMLKTITKRMTTPLIRKSGVVLSCCIDIVALLIIYVPFSIPRTVHAFKNVKRKRVLRLPE
jgi:hypothetical protein